MTDEERQKLIEAGKLVKDIFPKMHGSVQFNLHPERTNIPANIKETVILEKDNGHHKSN